MQEPMRSNGEVEHEYRLVCFGCQTPLSACSCHDDQESIRHPYDWCDSCYEQARSSWRAMSGARA